MGDGGVACVPLQHIMEKFPGSETLCGGTSSSNGNGKLETKSVRITSTGPKRMKLRRDAFFKKEEPEKVKSNREVENGGVSGEKVPREEQQEEMEEGELGTLKSPAREVENGEIEKGEIVSGKWRKHELEKDEFVAERVDRLRSNIVVRRNRTPEKHKRGDFEKEEFGFWRRGKDEIENGEFIPDRWRKDDYGYSKTTRRHHSSREREWRCEREWTPPSGRYSGEDVSPVREFSRSGSKRSKRSGRRKSKRERNYPKLGSKIVDESASCRNEYNRGKNHGREPSSSARMKRHGIDSDTSDLQYSDDHGEHASSKSRRLSGDSYRSSNSEHHSRRSAESHRNSSSSRGAFDKHSLRHHDSSSSSRAGIDRYKWSPSPSEHSPGDRARHHDYRDRDRASARHDRSPYHRGRHNDYRYRSPSYSERSPRDRSRRDRSPSYLERTPCDLSRPSNPREASTKTEVSETKQSKIQVKKLSDKDPNQTNSTAATKGCQDENTMKSESVETSITNQTDKVDLPHSPTRDCENQPLPSNGVVEEMASMEEDMDICDTPPHVPAFADVCLGKWYYVDHLGLDRGPSRLSDLKALVEGGILMSDHLIKHCDSDRWVTVENAASPMGTANYPTLVSDTITQLVTPPEAPGNLLIEAGDSEQPGSRASEEISVDLAQRVLRVDDRLGVPAESIEDLRIDERVDSLLEGVIVVPGKEMEIIADVLQMRFDQSEWERWGNAVGLLRDKPCSENVTEHAKEEDIPVCPETPLTDAVESTSSASVDKESVHFSCEFTEWFSSRWSCKGGDWRRNDEAVQDRFCRKKLVLNDGYPLCQMPKSGHEDPRWPRRDDLYYPSQSRKLDLPTWAFSCPDDRNDYNAVAKPGPPKPVVLRGVKGTFLPVVRINACVVKDHDSSVSEPRSRYRGKDRVSSKGIRHYSSSSDFRRSSTEDPPHLNSARERGSTRPWESAISINVPKDRLSTVEDLQLHLGGWYYLDGAGYERGPFLYSELQTLAERGLIEKQCSVFRKIDKVWVPVTPASSSPSGMKILEKDKALAGDSCWARNGTIKAATFHSLHPQFIGYTRGKLHELVMRSYKSREFAAAINEVLESWINTRQSKKEMEKHLYDGGPSFLNEDQMRAAKRARIITDGSQEEYGREEELSHPQIDDPSFEDLCSDVTFSKHELYSATNARSWGMLDGHILARVFHFLRADIKSLVFAASTCKHWRAAVGLYKNVSRQVNLSSFGSDCSNSILRSIMNGYNSDKIRSIVLIGCTNIGSGVLEEILCCFSCVSSVDIRGCSQLEELITKFPHLKWVVDGSSQAVRKFSDLHSKTRSLRQITDKASSVSKLGLGSYVDDSSGLKDYFDMVDKRNAANQAFRQSLYKRTKVFDARKSATVLSRDARIRRWTMKKPANVYKQMEDFLLVRLRDIMKENTCDFFVPRVGEIEGKIKSGYYARSGLSSVKEDINKMCRDATKMKTRSDGDVERIIALFIKLAARIGQMSKAAVNRGTMNALKDELSGSSEYGKYGKNVTERKYKKKVNGGPDGTEYSSDLEIRRRVSKLDRKLDSGSDSSDEFESSDDEGSDGASSASGAESDLGVRSESGACDTSIEEALDSSADDREWGARMTKASLVPPVTRKYDVIDQYVIVADEEEVQRKMRVSLPDDYDDRAKAQKNGTEELDMELPEVKDFKPRKQLGEEVIEQEVYGIDPYTHNLLLDSIPDDGDWPLTEKHHFVEDALLRVLNKQVRQFTGSRYTPMTYPLKPVIKEILQTAKEEDDMKTLKLCDAILKAMDSRLEDNYVAYRKGLGVVCNKEGGFGRDDFVVEFLGEVYPAWKWFEKQDGIRSLQKNSKDPAPEFYNIYLERPKGDADGYDLVVVDAMHKANYASRICHSCQPNCEAKVTAVDGYYQIGIYSVRPIAHGEEITFDYNSVTESKEEYEASVCLCGSQVCRGSYLNLTGEGAFQKVLKEWHGLLDKHRLLIEACELNWVSEEDYIELGKAGLGSCLLGGLPDWVIAYSARLVRFINFERTRLPEAILKHNLEEKSKYFVEICHELEKSDAEIEAEGVYNQRLQNLALTLDKVRYVLRCVFGDPKRAPPPLQRLGPEEMVSFLWKGEGSLVEELLQCIAPHIDNRMLEDLKSKIRAHDPSGSSDVEKELRKSLLWLRDEVRNLPCTNKSRHDGAADLIHVYAYTKSFFRIREYKSVTSPPVYISPLDLGPKYADKLSGITEYCKTYGDNYCLGQLIYWYNQANAEPEHALARASRGCLSLPDMGSFYAMPQKPPRQRVYGPRTVRFMVSRMEKQPQRPWPSDRIWSFKTSLKIFGSPMLDAVLNNAPLEREMMVWLKNRPAIFHAMWDR